MAEDGMEDHEEDARVRERERLGTTQKTPLVGTDCWTLQRLQGVCLIEDRRTHRRRQRRSTES